jgi:hypothetical protein
MNKALFLAATLAAVAVQAKAVGVAHAESLMDLPPLSITPAPEGPTISNCPPGGCGPEVFPDGHGGWVDNPANDLPHADEIDRPDRWNPEVLPEIYD